MANDEDAPWDLADGDGLNSPQPDPNASLKGKRSPTRAGELLQGQLDKSTLTSVTSDSIVVDNTQITGGGQLTEPATPDTRQPDVNSGSYASSADLLHWWRLAYDPTASPTFAALSGRDEIGSQTLTDTSGTTVDSGAAANPSGAASSLMWNQRATARIQNGRMRTGSDVTWPISTTFSFTCWVKNFDLAFGADAQLIFAIQDTSTTRTLADSIQVYSGRRTAGSDLLNNGTIFVNIHDDSGTEFSARSTNALSPSVWTHIAFTADLTAGTMAIYLDGSAETLANETTPSSLTVGLSTQTSRRPYIGSFNAASAFNIFGQIHSVCLWDTVLGASEISDLAGFGDGPEPVAPVLDYTNHWMTFHGPTNLNEVREVIDFDDTTGTYTLDSDLPATPLTGDFYRLWGPNGLFSAYDNDQSVRRPQKHRLVFFRNETGGQLTLARLYVKDIVPGPLVCEIAEGVRTGSDVFVVGVDDEEDTPDIVTLAGGFLQGDLKPQTFEKATSWAGAEFFTPRGRDQTVNDSAGIQAFIRLRFRDEEPIPLPGTRCVFQVFSDFNDGQTVGSLLVVVDVDGANELLTLGPDRKLRIGGGARVQAVITDVETGALIPNHTVNIALEPPSTGALGPQNKLTSDTTGIPVEAVYISSTDGADEGDDVTFTIEVN